MSNTLSSAKDLLRQVREVLALCNDGFAPSEEVEEVHVLGERLGFGALMAAASKAWADRLREGGVAEGGEFTVGPCKATVDETIQKIDAFLAEAESAESSETETSMSSLLEAVEKAERSTERKCHHRDTDVGCDLCRIVEGLTRVKCDLRDAERDLVSFVRSRRVAEVYDAVVELGRARHLASSFITGRALGESVELSIRYTAAKSSAAGMKVFTLAEQVWRLR